MGITPLSTANYNASTNVTGRGPVLEFPVALNTISLFHSVPGVNIQLDGPTAAAIFQNQIQYWNDPKIAACTGIPVSQLPNQRINLAVRSDPTAITSYVAQYFNATYFPLWYVLWGILHSLFFAWFGSPPPSPLQDIGCQQHTQLDTVGSICRQWQHRNAKLHGQDTICNHLLG